MSGKSNTKDACLYFQSRQVVVHPIVLLSIVDHFNRVALGPSKRVVGTLLGEISEGNIHVTNSFAVPFEEDAKDPTVWFFDIGYHQRMVYMFKKVNVGEKVVGWYSSAAAIKPADLEIHEIYRKHHLHPVYLIVNTQPKDSVVPVDAYFSIEEATSEKLFRRKFVHIPSTIGAYEAEEVGVEHLLRDVRSNQSSILVSRVVDCTNSIMELCERLLFIYDYLRDVSAGEIAGDIRILLNTQEILSLLPEVEKGKIAKAVSMDVNDTMLTIYLGSTIRSVMGIHKLINNKLENKRLLSKASL